MPKPKTFEEKCQFWAAHAAAKQRESTSFADYCKRHGLALSSFSHWRRRLAKRASGLAIPAARREHSMRLLPVTLVGEPGRDSGLSVVSASGQRIAVATHFDPATLQRLLAVLDGQR